MYIIAQFNSSNVPKTGLTPDISIRDVASGSLTVATTTMSEIGDGFYRYDFAKPNRNQNYTVLCSAGTDVGVNERYTWQVVEFDRNRGTAEK